MHTIIARLITKWLFTLLVFALVVAWAVAVVRAAPAGNHVSTGGEAHEAADTTANAIPGGPPATAS